MRLLYFDCFAGISGDMTLGALIDVGADPEAIAAPLRTIPEVDFDLRTQTVTRHGICATDVSIVPRGPTPQSRSLAEIEELISASELSPRARELALRIFHVAAEGEAAVHGVPRERVHFHELGGVDSIVDICGTAVALELLAVERIACSPLPMSRGFVSCAHGKLPVPAPAVAEIVRGLPVVPLDVEGETVTPTGAAIVKAVAEEFGPPPAMTIEAVGYGSGKREREELPNLLRVFLGEAEEVAGVPVVEIEANVDDASAETLGFAMERLLAEGALDVLLIPAQMKKNRPGTLISVLARPGDELRLARIMLRETSTIGVRFTRAHRLCLPRREVRVSTPFGEVRVKVVRLSPDEERAAPEYDDCAAAARRHGVPLATVYQAALVAYSSACEDDAR